MRHRLAMRRVSGVVDARYKAAYAAHRKRVAHEGAWRMCAT